MKKLFVVAALCAAAALSAGTMTLESGNYKFAFSSGKNLWTMTGIQFKGRPLAHRTGYYGNVFSPASGKYIGAGHTEGGLEKLISVNVNVDGKTYRCDIYTSDDGTTVKYYYLNGELKRMETVSDGSETIIEFKTISGSVNKTKFRTPKGTDLGTLLNSEANLDSLGQLL